MTVWIQTHSGTKFEFTANKKMQLTCGTNMLFGLVKHFG